MVKPTCSMFPGLPIDDTGLRPVSPSASCMTARTSRNKIAPIFANNFTNLWKNFRGIFEFPAYYITWRSLPSRGTWVPIAYISPQITTIGPGCALTNPLPHQCIVQCDDTKIFHQEQLLWLSLSPGVLSWRQDVSDTDQRFPTSALSNWRNVNNDANIRINWTVNDSRTVLCGCLVPRP